MNNMEPLVTQSREKHGQEMNVHLGKLKVVNAIFIGFALLIGLVASETYSDEISRLSSTIANFRGDYSFLLVIIALPAYALSVLFSNLLANKPAIFFIILIFVFAIAEASIPVLHSFALGLRYLMMAILIANGLIMLVHRKEKLEVIQLIGLVMLLWIILHIVFDTYVIESVLMLPMQFTIYIGLIIGIVYSIKDLNTILKILNSLALVGVVTTAIHTSALFVLSDAYLGGRFRSFYLLPTNFSNNYVLLLIPILWKAINDKQLFVKLVYFGFALLGLMLLILSGTRNAMLAATIALVVFFVIWKRHYSLYFFVFSIVASLVILASDLSFTDLGAGNRLSTVSKKETRFEVWQLAWNYIQVHPFWGYGLSSNMKDFDSKLPTWMSFGAHNAYLGIWLRLGILGLLFILFTYFSMFFLAFRELRTRENDNQRESTIVLLFTLLVVLFVAGMFEENLSSRGSIQQLIWGMTIALLLATRRLRVKKSTKNNLSKIRSGY